MQAILKMLLPVLVVCATGLAGQAPGQTEEPGQEAAESREIEVTVLVQDHEGNPVPGIPVDVLSLIRWHHREYDSDGQLLRRTDERGEARVAITVEEDEAYVLIEVGAIMVWPSPDHPQPAWSEWARPHSQLIDIRDGASAYRHTATLRPTVDAQLTITDTEGDLPGWIFLSSSRFSVSHRRKPPFFGESRRITKGVDDVLVGFDSLMTNPRPLIVEVDASQTTGDLVELTAKWPAYAETTAKLDLRRKGASRMVNSGNYPSGAVTLISPDGSLVYCFRWKGPDFVWYRPLAHGKAEPATPSVEPGRYLIAPGALSYPPTMKLYQHIRAGNDPTGSITELTAIEDQTVERVLDFVQLEADIIELLGL